MSILYRWFEEVWNQGREAAIEEMLDAAVKSRGLTDAAGNEVDGLPAFKDFYRQFRSAFPDIHIQVEDTVSEGDRTVARCHVTATHTGVGLAKAPTGKPVEFRGMTMVRVRDGKIVESWNNFDFATLTKQLE
jgi:predicted ester cyclase